MITAPIPKHDNGVNVIRDVSVIGDTDSNCDLDNWIFPTTGNRLRNWKTEDVILISFSQE